MKTPNYNPQLVELGIAIITLVFLSAIYFDIANR